MKQSNMAAKKSNITRFNWAWN